MDTPVSTIVDFLLIEQHRVDPVRYAAGADPVLTAAAALTAGEPRLALRHLAAANPADAVMAALRKAAYNLDLHRYPGGAGADRSDREALLTGAQIPPTYDPDEQLVVLVAARLLPTIQTARRIAEDAFVAGEGAIFDELVTWFEELDADAGRLPGGGMLRPYMWIAAADVAQRAGRPYAELAGLLDRASGFVGDNLAAQAHLCLAEADFRVAPLSHPECLGLLLAGPAVADAVEPTAAIAAASDHYRQAGELYARVGSMRGLAAVALRQAYLSRLRGDAADRDRWLAETRRLGLASGDQRIVRLADLHALVDRCAGDDASTTDAEAVAGWVATAGGQGFANGSIRLLVAQGTVWRAAGSGLSAMRALRAARRIAARCGSPVEIALAERAEVELADSINFRPAALILAAAAEARAADQGASWQQSALAAIALHRTVQGFADPAMCEFAVRRLTASERAADPVGDADHMVLEYLREAVHQAEVSRLRYGAQRAWATGDRERASWLCEKALQGAGDDTLLRAVLLVELRRFDEATAEVRRLEASGLPDDALAELYLRAHQPAEARRVLDRAGSEGRSDRPWESLTRRAEVELATGDVGAAMPYAGRAVEAYERLSAGLVRDVFRTAVADQRPVAATYHAGVLARLGRAAQVTGAEHDREVAAAFELADRGRGIVLDVLDRLDGVSGPVERAAVRDWLRSGAHLAAVSEGLVGELIAGTAMPEPDALLARIHAAEDEVDDAEARVARVAPAFLAATDGPRRHPGLDEVRDALPPDAVLLLYQAFDEDLVVWAVRPGEVRHKRVPTPVRDLIGNVRAFHTACANSTIDQDVAEALTAALLAPVAGIVDSAERVYVVPHGPLALLPFHALPYGGDVLGARRTVSLLPSAGLITRPGAGRKPLLDQPALLVGDPAYAEDTELPRLGGTATEVATIARLIGTPDPLTGEHATARAVTDLAPGRRVLHLATHGFVDDRSPHRGHLALAGHDRLAVPDVLGLDLAADLVVFSACHTGRGTATAGGDVIGLARAAVAAGARHLVVSLWPVDDESGCLIMTGLYEHLRAGDDVGVGDALAAAQRHVRGLDAAGRADAYRRLCEPAVAHHGTRDGVAATGSAPDGTHHWAPFVHIGV